MRVLSAKRLGGCAAAVMVAVVAGCGQRPSSSPSTSPDPPTGSRHCGTIDVRGTSAYPAAGTSINAETCFVVQLHACRPGANLVVFDMGVDTSRTTTYAVDAASCHLAVSDTFFAASFGGRRTTTTYTCGTASVNADGLRITGCTSTNGSTAAVPALTPSPTPLATPTL
jgi:hypothetical protein